MRAKKGEVVEPAGGETGGPRCLAEVRKLLVAALFRRFRFQAENITFYKEPVKEKNKFFWGKIPSRLILSTKLIYWVLKQNASQKSVFFSFFAGSDNYTEINENRLCICLLRRKL
ncbi:MAG: hypothetical protein JSW23_02070 [Planctomycetota bacterium]|nr:MAG: hypothetical protein JSW23_02070 [Planctomycetota bacterium]